MKLTLLLVILFIQHLTYTRAQSGCELLSPLVLADCEVLIDGCWCECVDLTGPGCEGCIETDDCQTSAEPSADPTDIPTTLEPTPAPTLPTIACGQIERGQLSTDENIQFQFNIPSDNLYIEVSTCHTFTEFDTTLKLFDDETLSNQLAIAQDGCNDDLGRARLFLNNYPIDTYILVLESATSPVEGRWEIDITCDTHHPTQIPTADPTEFPSMNPTGNTTDDCPECAFNVTLIGIGNITIEECEDTPTPTYWSRDSSSHNDWYKHKHKPKDNHHRGGRHLLGNYNKPWGSTYNNKKYPTPKPTKWVADRVCIERDVHGHNGRHLLGYGGYGGHRKEDDDGCNGGHVPTPKPTNGFIEWYKDKCDIDDYKHGYKYSKWGQKYGNKEHKYGYKYTSWHKHKDKTDEFITEVCMNYGIIDLIDDDIYCGEVTEIFLGICENNYTDFNASILNENDLNKLIVSINNNSDNNIESIEGVTRDDTLGLLITFSDGHNVTEFELCLGNVTVNSQFNNEIDMIDIGEGIVVIDNETECVADGLPCLNFFFDVPCPPETTKDKMNCDCDEGVTSLNVLYAPSNGLNANIKVYYNPKKMDEILCEFENVTPGDEINCDSDPFQKLHKTTYYVINYNNRRRLGGGNHNHNDGNEADCVGKFYTSCQYINIGDISTGCDDLEIISYTHGDGSYCDENILNEDDEIDTANALINDKQIIQTPLKVLEELDPYILYTLIGVIAAFIGLMVVAFCICIVRKSDNESEGDEEIIKYHRDIQLKNSKDMIVEKEINEVNSNGNDKWDENEYYDENSIEMEVMNKLNKS